MKKMFLLLALIAISTNLSAQEAPLAQAQRFPQSPDGGFSIHFGGAFPVGNFGEEPDTNRDVFAGFDTGKFSAAGGFSIGMRAKFPISTDGWGVFVSGDLLYNGLKGMLRDAIEEYETNGVDVVKHKYLNIPLFLGLNYRYDVNSKIGLWIEGGAGPNFRKITNLEFSNYNASYSDVYSYKMQTAFGFQIGGGLMLNDRFSIGLHYYGGATKIREDLKWTEGDVSGTEPYSYNKKSPQNSVLLRLGYHF